MTKYDQPLSPGEEAEPETLHPEAPDAHGPYLPLYLDQELIATLLQVIDPSGRPAGYELDESFESGTSDSEENDVAGRLGGALAGIGISGQGRRGRRKEASNTNSAATRTQYVVETATLFEAAHAQLRTSGFVKAGSKTDFDAIRAGMWLEFELTLAAASPEQVLALIVQALFVTEKGRLKKLEALREADELLRKKPTAEVIRKFTEQGTSFATAQASVLDALVGALLESAGEDEAPLAPIAEALNEDLKTRVVDDLVATPAGDSDGPSVILTVDREKFTAAHEGMLVGARFHVLGKVTNVIGEGESLPMTRRSLLSMFDDDVVDSMLGELPGPLGKAQVSSRVDGPAVQLLPLAIWV